MVSTDIVLPQKTKTIQAANHLKVKTVSVLTKLSPSSSPPPPRLLHLNYTTRPPRIVEQIVNLLPTTSPFPTTQKFRLLHLVQKFFPSFRKSAQIPRLIHN